MALALLVVGDMGTGKSTALRNLPPTETVIVSPNNKDLPWEGGMEDYDPIKRNFFLTNKLRTVDGKPGLDEIIKQVNTNAVHVKYLVIEDFTHFMNDRTMDDKFIKNTDWGKWNTFGADVFASTVKDFAALRNDLTIILIGHTEAKDNGETGMLTSGKLLDNVIKIPSYFTYIFHSRVFTENNQNSYKFQTNKVGGFLAKTPMGAFKDLYVDNDLKAIIDRIKEYRSGAKRPIPAEAQAKVPETLK
jgi:hypothetical protein